MKNSLCPFQFENTALTFVHSADKNKIYCFVFMAVPQMGIVDNEVWSFLETFIEYVYSYGINRTGWV